MNICKISSQKESSVSCLLQERNGQTYKEDFFLFILNYNSCFNPIPLIHLVTQLVGNLLGTHHVHRKPSE